MPNPQKCTPRRCDLATVSYPGGQVIQGEIHHTSLPHQVSNKYCRMRYRRRMTASTGSELFIHGARICDPAQGQSDPADVLIRDGVIVEVGHNLSAPKDIPTYDASGLFLTPGLIDAHVHVTAASADLGAVAEQSPYYVAAHTSRILRGMAERGFTTVRDCGGADYGIAAAVDEGLWQGPGVVFGGKALSPTGGHADLRGPGRQVLDDHVCCPNLGVVCDGVDEVRRSARHQLRTGAHHIKLMLSGGVASPTDRIDSLQFSDAEISAAVDEASNANRYCTGHAYTAAAVNRGLRLGVRGIEHGNLIDDESVRLFKEHDAFLIPTLSTYEFLHREGAAAGLPVESQRKVSTVLEEGLHALDRAAKGGVKIAFGTDLLGAMHRHQSAEFTIRAQVQSPLEIMRSATTVAAELIGRSADLGLIAEGAQADLLVVDGDPLEDASVLAHPAQNVRHVIRGGRVD